MTVSLLEGHVVDVLGALPAGHFHCAVTSPPYLWLRAYGTDGQDWEDGWVGELGQEPSPELYVEHLVAVFRSVRRVLRPDGTLWVNLAGCYYNDPGGQNGPPREPGAFTGISSKAVEANAALGRQKRGRHPWLKPLDWVDVPGLFARAMQQDGWCWRSDVVWVKPSALPESVSGTRWERCKTKTKPGQSPKRQGQPWVAGEVSGGVTHFPPAEWADCPGCPKCAATDGLVLRRGSGRPTKATERVLLFTRGPGYYFDQEAVRENLAEATLEREQYSLAGGDKHRALRPGDGDMIEGGLTRTTAGLKRERTSPASGRNLRDWWVIGSEPLKDAHYAAFPSALPERCIKAGTSEWGCCPACGAPWARVIDARASLPGREHWASLEASDGTQGRSRPGGFYDMSATTLGWRPTCRCPGVAEQAPVPCRVLDPFGGSGTTALAANRLGRDCTLVELKPEYSALARKRVGREPLSLFAWKPEDTPEEVGV